MPARRAAGAKQPASNGEILGGRALNRAFLARQLLLEREDMPADNALRHLYALQAQSPTAPYIALWARLHDFRPEQLSELLINRAVVRIALMRSTLHLVRADDCLTMRPLVQPVLERGFRSAYGRHLIGLDLAEVAAAGRSAIATRWPRRSASLSRSCRPRRAASGALVDWRPIRRSKPGSAGRSIQSRTSPR
jgi:hypothetical protein